MSSDPTNAQNRASILAAIRRHTLTPLPRPETDGPWIRYESRWEQFRSSLESVGGQLHHVAQLADVGQVLDHIPAYRDAKKRIVCLPTFSAPTATPAALVDLATVDDAHDLADVDFAVVPGEFGVAENGAIYVTDRAIRHRAIYFIPQHLSLVFPAARIVDTMHEAYDQITFDDNCFRCFISGPSKTADIEQSLVIGAHGARSLTVITYGDPQSLVDGSSNLVRF